LNAVNVIKTNLTETILNSLYVFIAEMTNYFLTCIRNIKRNNGTVSSDTDLTRNHRGPVILWQFTHVFTDFKKKKEKSAIPSIKFCQLSNSDE